ncbi:MAG: hypothetical protein JNM56_34330, partial [Planctomycetia bacterium]|nr:hypothetical protein [Planctomycetia bacterium]
MGFAQDWTNAKKNFENKTKQKKPSEKVLGVFRKSSGLEKATQALDNALNKCDLADMDRAAKGYATASSAYQDLLSRTDS